jgi:hypothetical protein
MSSDGEDNEDFYDDEFEDDGFGQDEAPNSGESCLLSTSCAARQADRFTPDCFLIPRSSPEASDPSEDVQLMRRF